MRIRILAALRVRWSVVFFAAAFLFLVVWQNNASAAVVFMTDKDYDARGRNEITAELAKASLHGDFYFESEYWTKLADDDKTRYLQALDVLVNEFEQIIFPRLTQFFGDVGSGPDGSPRTSILFHELRQDAGGYFNAENLYPKTERTPHSNERNIIFLDISKLRYPIIKALLAHEFQHVISFYKKDKVLRQSEDVWLNELRSEYAPTLLGYDDLYESSNLRQRIDAFVQNPSDPLTEWMGTRSDYGIVSVFGQYLADQFGKEILQKSLASSVTGIESIEASLRSLGYGKNFFDIFRDFVVASLLNDCSVEPRGVYCFKNPNLAPQNLKIRLGPLGGGTQVGITPYAKNWQGNWYEFVASDATPKILEISFSSEDPEANFRVPYVLKRRGKALEAKEFNIINQSFRERFEDFGSDIFAISVMPIQGQSRVNHTGNDPGVKFSLEASILEEKDGKTVSTTIATSQNVNQSLSRILPLSQEQRAQETARSLEALEKQLFELLQKKREEILRGLEYFWTRDLHLGLRNDKDVSALQQALRNERVYGGPITGYFGQLTLEAVKKFQEKYGLPQAGRIGPKTRDKLNELYGRKDKI